MLIRDNPLHTLDSNFVFTTEGHPIHLPKKSRARPSSHRSAPKCQAPSLSRGLFSPILSTPDVFHPFTPNTTLNTIFLPYLDTREISTPRTILEAWATFRSPDKQEFDIIFPPANSVQEGQNGNNVQWPGLPPLRTAEGVHVPDLSGLRLRFVKLPDERLMLSMGEFLDALPN